MDINLKGVQFLLSAARYYRSRRQTGCRALWLGLAMALVRSLGLTPSARALEHPSAVGAWSAVQQWAVVAVHALMLPTGKVLFWAYDYESDFYLWDPADDPPSLPALAANPLQNLFCSAHSFLPDGRVLVSGGHNRNNDGLDTANIYDPDYDTWTPVANMMNDGRWYPGSMTLANGDVLVTSGDNKHKVNQLPQVFELATMSWRDLIGAQSFLPLYPRNFLAPDGRAFFATATSRLLDTSGAGDWRDVADRIDASRDNYGSAVMYERGKVLWVGGGDPPTATCEVIDLNVPTPAWQPTGSMAQPRRQNNVTILPDGKVFATGGSSSRGFDDESGAVFTAEMWNPATGNWTTMASYQQYRGYHSTALLLPDGRVLSSGGDDQPNAEIYSPPYLFQDGTRPTIDGAPESVVHGEEFSVETADAPSIVQVTLIRAGSTTHALNFDQWFCPLTFTYGADATHLNATVPSSAYDCPPGPYMLFILNGDGVPSVAEFLTLGASVQPPDCDSLEVQTNTVSTVNIGQGRKIGHAEVTVQDDCGPADPPVLVAGRFSGDITEGILEETTNGQGLAVFETAETSRGKVDLMFCVETLDGNDYVGANACANN